MPYLANIPLGNDQLNVSQGQILDNFQALSTYVFIDHVEFNLADQGKHKVVQMFPNTVFTNVIPNANNQEIVMGCQADGITLRNELTLKRNGETISVLTSKRSNAGVLTDINNQIRLMSGLLFKFGLRTLNGNQGGQITINFNVGNGYVPFNAIYNVFISNFAVNGQTDINVRLMSFNTTSVTVYVSERTSTSTNVQNFGFSILAIGI